MKSYLRDLVAGTADPNQARNRVREYIQARILGGLQRAGAMIPLAFCGGTALRFLHGTSRYSEDLDFTLEREPSAYDLRGWLRKAQAEFDAEGYAAELKISDRRTVHSAMIRLPGLLHELRLSPRRELALSVKIEVDTRPPAGAVLETTVVRRHVTLRLQHHDRASLLAGKLHAVLQRPYLKGRDIHDLLWYLADPAWPPPNLTLLNHALAQTGWTAGRLNEAGWPKAVRARLREMSWEGVVADVRPFLDSSADLELLTRETLLRLLR